MFKSMLVVIALTHTTIIMMSTAESSTGSKGAVRNFRHASHKRSHTTGEDVSKISIVTTTVTSGDYEGEG